MAGHHRFIVTCAHVVARQTEFQMLTAGPTNNTYKLRLLFALPRYDLAVLARDGSSDQDSLHYGDIRRLRPGDKVFYMGYKGGTLKILMNPAVVSAVGSVWNEGAIIDFIEFQGEGLPGYSGGPVFDSSGNVVGIMREAWTKRGIKGGASLLINRAFSVEILAQLDQEIFSPSTGGVTNHPTSNTTLLDAIWQDTPEQK